MVLGRIVGHFFGWWMLDVFFTSTYKATESAIRMPLRIGKYNEKARGVLATHWCLSVFVCLGQFLTEQQPHSEQNRI